MNQAWLQGPMTSGEGSEPQPGSTYYWQGSTPPARTAPAAEHPCELRGYHSPKPLRTQYHHSRPVYLQNRVYGRILHPADLWVCGTDHDSLHTVIDWLLGEGREPTVEPGRLVLAQAQRTVDWYLAAKENSAL